MNEEAPADAEKQPFVQSPNYRKIKIGARLGALAAVAVLSHSVLSQEKTYVTVPENAERIETDEVGDIVHNVPANDARLVDCGGVRFSLPFIGLDYHKTPDREVAPQDNGEVQVTCHKAFGTPDVRE